MEGIDESLNLLKELQEKLKKKQIRPAMGSEPYYTSPQPNRRVTPNPISFNNRQSIRSPSNGMHKSTPMLIEDNQQNYEDIKDVIKENKRLKKYVNCLLQMNDYLKNQLVSKNHYDQKVNQMGHSFELNLVRMEIEYLKELNRDKELELKRSMYLAEKAPKMATSTAKKHKRIASTSDCQYYSPSQLLNKKPGNKGHLRSISTSDVYSRPVHSQPREIPEDDCANCSAFTKNAKKSQNKSHVKKKTTSTHTKKKKPQTICLKKCRLCYI